MENVVFVVTFYQRYNKKLRSEGCDMILPLCHLYEFQDEKTCEMFDFPVVLSGHDHHKVDRSVRRGK